MLLDALCLYLAFDLSLRKNFISYQEAFDSHGSFYTIWVLLWIIIALFSNHYNTKILKRVLFIIQSTGKVVLIHMLFIFVYLLTTPQYFEISYLIDSYFFSILVTIGAKVLLLYSYRLLSNQQENQVNFIIVGKTPTTVELLRSLGLNKKFGHHFFGYLDKIDSGKSNIVAAYNEIEEFCKKNKINYIYFDSSVDAKVMSRVIKYANNNYIRFAIVHDPITIPFKEVETSIFNNVPVVHGRNFSNASRSSITGMKGLINLLKT